MLIMQKKGDSYVQPEIIILLPKKSNYCPKHQFSAKKKQQKTKKNLVTLVSNKIDLVPKNSIY